MSKYSPPIDSLFQPKLWVTLAQPRGPEVFQQATVKTYNILFPHHFVPSLDLFFMVPVLSFLSLQECAKQELEASAGSTSGTAQPWVALGERLHQSWQGKQRDGGRCWGCCLQKEKTHMAASQPANRGSAARRQLLTDRVGQSHRLRVLPLQQTCLKWCLAETEGSRKEESHQPPCDYGLPTVFEKQLWLQSDPESSRIHFNHVI